MTAGDWQRVDELFKEARAKSVEERVEFLNEACGSDAELRAEVESLLQHDGQVTEGFLSPPQPMDKRSPATKTVEPDMTLPAPGPTPEIEGYEIVRELHRGGQGVVYQALQKSTKHKVAIKVLLEGPYASKKTKRRFEREIELAASLRHPNIVAIFHSGQTDTGQQFCVMDYVRGVPLTEYVKSNQPSLEESLNLFAMVCEAVSYAHQHGVIHRDLKPNNILVDSEGQPKVLDFGLAKTVGGPEQSLVSVSGQIVGTLAYMSPEQTRGNPDEIDTRTDVYALGVILYELLTGKYPYPVVDEMAKVLRHIAQSQPHTAKSAVDG